MNISLNWLKEYLKIDLSVEKVCEILTSIGLEVGGYEKFESIRGGLRGLVIGEVKTCEAHPDSDHLHLTTVDLGDGRLTPIVCGAPNVAAGQKVVVATIGTVLYDGDKEFIPVHPKTICGQMKKVTLESVQEALEKEQYVVEVAEDIRQRAWAPIERMLQIK